MKKPKYKPGDIIVMQAKVTRHGLIKTTVEDIGNLMGVVKGGHLKNEEWKYVIEIPNPNEGYKMVTGLYFERELTTL